MKGEEARSVWLMDVRSGSFLLSRGRLVVVVVVCLAVISGVWIIC